MADRAAAEPRPAPAAGTAVWATEGAAWPSVQCASSLLPPSFPLPGLLTVQVAAWDGHLPPPAFGDCQGQQAEAQHLGGCHGYLKHGG